MPHDLGLQVSRGIRRKKLLYGQIRKHLGEIFHELARQREYEVVEGHLRPDHVHMRMSIPPKYAVSNVVGFVKGKSAIAIARTIMRKEAQFHWGELLGQRIFRLDGRSR